MSAEDVQVKICQQDIVKLDLQIRALVQDIRECNDVEDLHQLNYDAKEKIRELKSRIDLMAKLAIEQDKETDKVILLKEANSHREHLTGVLTSLRAANLSSQEMIEKREKDSLLKGDTTAIRRRPKSDKESMAKTSSNITETMMSLSRMMYGEVKRSEDTMEHLVSSSKQVTDTQEEFKGMAGHIENSKRLLTKYGRRELTDKLLILLALIFFFATVLYIIKKRLLGVSEDVSPMQHQSVQNMSAV